MKWESINKKEDNSINLPDSWLFTHYFEALNTLFRIENSLRVFLFAVLKTTFEEKWLNINVTSDDDKEATISKIAKQRMAQAKTFGYLGYKIPCPLMYMTSGELIRIITSDSYWKYFNIYFLGSKEIIKTKLEEIGSVRNALAHFRPIKQDDVELIKQNARHVLSNIETCLVDMMSCANTVPTNTPDDWYKELRALGTDHCMLSFNQSNDEKWIMITFLYNCPVVYGRESPSLRIYRVLSIKTSSILQLFPILQGSLVFLVEEQIEPFMKENVPQYGKEFKMLFSRELLNRKYKEVKKEIENLLFKISEEINLLEDDNLAKGELVYGIKTWAQWKKHANEDTGWWSFNYENLRCEVREDDPPEYWGTIHYIGKDYVTSTEDYPWMPVSISKSEIPF
jgi:hypothetical protein